MTDSPTRLRRILTSAAAILLAATLASAGQVPAAIADDRAPEMSPNLEWVAHRDNPLRQGDSHYYINSDLAFSGDYLVQGNYDGFSLWDISTPADPQLLSAVQCAGGQGDVSAIGNLVFFSVDETMSSDRCDASRVPETSQNWEGIRIFDISDPRNPQYVTSVQTRCGSHTHTVIPDPASDRRVYIYANAYSRGASLNCTGRNPQQIIAVDLDDPAAAAVVAEVDFFTDETAFGPSDRVAGGAETRSTTGCHDITAYPAKNLAVAACRGDGLLLDITDPLHPQVIQQVRDSNVAFWHSGIFSNDGSMVVFQDELGDGFINTCSPSFGADRGADALWSLADRQLTPAGYFKIGREQSGLEKCTAHSGGIIPLPDRTVLVQAWLEGGVSIIDLTDPAAPAEIGYFDKPTYGYSHEYTAGVWAAYYYRGHIFASDMYDGLEVLRLVGPEFADAARYADSELNPQTQPQYDWVWRTAPVVPTAKKERATLAAVDTTPARITPGTAATIEVQVPAGTLTPGETVDVWWMADEHVAASVTATDDGRLPDGTTIAVPAGTGAGEYDIVVRGDQSAPTIALGVLAVKKPAEVALAGDAADTGSGLGAWIVVLGALALALGGAAVVLGARRRRLAVRQAGAQPEKDPLVE